MIDPGSTICVTGGCGFIGSNFLHLLAEVHKGRVVILDRLTYAGRLENLDGLRHEGVFWRGDIANPDDVEEVFQRFCPDYVVNFAAESHVDRSIVGASDFVLSNVKGVQVLLDACLKHGIKRFLQVGTDEVYGDIPAGAPPATEESPIKPSSPYSAAKTAGDLIALSYVRTHDLDVVVTRSSNNYGYRQFPEKLIPLMILNAIENKPLPVYGDGKQIRDWIYVDDNCRGIWTVLQKGIKGEAYNIGGGNQTENIWIVKKILEILGKPESLIEYVEDRKGHDVRYDIDSSKAANLGWNRVVNDVERGLKDTVNWYRENEWWWKPIREKKATTTEELIESFKTEVDPVEMLKKY